MGSRDLQVVPLTPTIGAEVRGADLINLDDAQYRQLRDALTAHQVIFLRDQPALSPTQQIALGQRFGPLHKHPAAPHLDGFPDVFVIHTTRDSQIANGNGWHTDVSCDERPPLATLLQLHVLPASGGDTLFASTYAAYETLSEPLQTLLCTLTATHASEHVYRGRYADRGVDDAGRVYPSSEHPVIRTHPDSGRRALYVNRAFTTKINELTRRESDALLGLLFAHIERPEFQVRFSWTDNALAIWDNRCTQHFALWDYWPSERKGHRVTVEGERPYLDRKMDPTSGSPTASVSTRLSRGL
jgi:taurine dioxygenase